MRPGFRLRTLGLVAVVAAFASGLGAAWLWSASNRAWDRHLAQAHEAGMLLFEALRTGGPLPEGISAQPLPPEQAALAERGEYLRLPGLPAPAYVTNVSIHGPGRDRFSGETLTLGIVSGGLRYAVSDLVSREGQTAAQKTGTITRLLATYCSEPVLIARLGDSAWARIDGTALWGCAAAPRDLRLVAVLVAVLALAILFTHVSETAARFNRFARALGNRRRFGGPESYSEDGPEELREIVAAVNSYLEEERDQLSKRAILLSGVSHDLGTPATRLRLRAALIEDAELREKLEADIDQMTGMIESVLTYTRSELNVEEPRQLSLASLVEALVDDYRDMGRPVELMPIAPRVVDGTGSLFSAKRGHGAMHDLQRILVTARPISLQRAVSNLIDNALKYGRRANVRLEAGADHARIVIEDEGSEIDIADIEAAFAPFRRGSNTGGVNGFGLGLTIAATVAEQHGGRLYFETGANGLRACLEIARV